MMLRGNLTRVRAIGAASLLIVFAGSTACERAKSPPPPESGKPTQFDARSIPESSPEAFGAYAASHLPPGLKHGDFLTKNRDYPRGDTADVYRAVLDTLYTAKDGSPGEVVLDDIAHTRVVTCTSMPCPLMPMTSREVRMATMDAYRAATLTRRHIRPFKYRLPIRMLNDDDRRSLEIDGRRIVAAAGTQGQSNQEHPFWVGFAAKYPHAWGMARLSTVGIDPERKEALVEVSHLCGTSCESIEVMWLWKVRGKWHVAERLPEYADSTDRGTAFLRFRGVGAKKPLVVVRAEAAADSVQLAGLPRDIHGTLTTQDGRPLAGATLTLHPDENPNVPSARVSTDSLGRYRFENPAVGGNGIMVRCPPASAQPDTLMAITGADVKPGKQFQFDMTLNRAICDDTAYGGGFQTILAPFDAPPIRNKFDVERSMKSAFPSPEEAAVYRTLLDNMFGIQPGDVRLLYGATRSACKAGKAACNREWLERIRYEPTIVMSAMENFLERREQKLDFGASFAPGPTVTMIGDSAIAQLQRASGYGNAFDNPAVLQRAWPNVKRVFSFSPVGFSPHRTQAIVEVITAGDGENSELWILNRQGTTWQIVRWMQLR